MWIEVSYVVVRRAMLADVADEAFVWGEAELADGVVEEASGRANEGDADFFFVLARCFTDERESESCWLMSWKEIWYDHVGAW